jgi:hypothetical protein
MSANWKNGLVVVLVAAVVVLGLMALARMQPVRAEADPPSTAGPHYSVVETEAHNLIVTDNQTNMLYFYTIDKDKEVGSELKLRGSVDLKEVGKPVIKPTTTK